MNTEYRPLFSSMLNQAFTRPEFTSLEPNQYGEFVKEFTDLFAKKYGISDEEDKKYYYDLSENELSFYKKDNNLPRYVPTQEQSSELFERFPDLSSSSDINEVEDKVDEWKQKSFEKASQLRPAERDDISTYLDSLSNEFIRGKASDLNQTGWLGDKTYRFVEGFAKPLHELIDKPGAERAWAKRAPEDPERDEEFSSLLASGFGQAGMQIAVAGALTMSGNPELTPYVFAAMFSAQYMKDGYYEEMRRSGDEDKAWTNAVYQIPAAFLETIGDVALVRGVTKTARQYGKAFAEATTEAEKRAILKEALPSMRRASYEGFLAESTVGGFGAEFASGYGAYKATGDEKYLRSFSDLVRSGLAEGIVGGVVSGGINSFTQSGIRERLSEDISVLTGFDQLKAKHEGLVDALKNRDFNKVISLTEGKFVDPSEFDTRLEISDTLRGRSTDEKGEPVAAKPESARVPVSAPITSRTRGLLLKESLENDSEIAKLTAIESRTEEEQSRLDSLTERNTYVKNVVESINNRTYTNPTEIDLSFDESNDAFYNGKESKESNTRAGLNEVVLENAEVLDSDGAIVYFDEKFQDSFNSAVAVYGKDNVFIKRNINGNNAALYIRKDGKVIKTNAEFDFTLNPKKGLVPVSFKEESEESKNVKVKFFPKVDKYKTVPANFEIVEDNGDSVKIKNTKSGEVSVLTKERADFAREYAKKAEEKKAKKKKEPTSTEPTKEGDRVLPSLLDDSETDTVEEKPYTNKKISQSDPMSILVNDELNDLSVSKRKKLTPNQFERQSLEGVSDKGIDLWHEGSRGRVKKDNTTGRFYFEPEDKSKPQIELNGNAESSIGSVGITKGSAQNNTNKAKDLIDDLKSKLDQKHHNSIEGLRDIENIINTLTELGVEYKVMTSDEVISEYGDKASNSVAFATSDGKIVFNSDLINKLEEHEDLLKITGLHESAHAGIYVVANQNPELYTAAKESLLNNSDLVNVAKEEYGKDKDGKYRFDSMNQDGIFHETIRMIIEGRILGRTTGMKNSGPLKAFFQKLVNYLKNILWRNSDKIVFQFVKNVENAMGVKNSQIQISNNNVTVSDIPSNIISDFVRIINSEVLSLDSYSLKDLNTLEDLMRLKRSDKSVPRNQIIKRINKYKPKSSELKGSDVISAQDSNFSFKESDAEYLDTVEIGDNGNDNLRDLLRNAAKDQRKGVVAAWVKRNPKAAAELQRMVDAAAKAAGLVAGFHGTPRETRLAPNEFRTTGGSTLGAGAYFAEDKTQADRYDFRGDAQMYFLDVELPGFDEFNKGLTTEEIAAGKTTPLEGTGKNGGWIVQNGEVEFVVRDPSQIKSADPVTYDDQGNVIPLSQRFDSTNNNIQNSQPITNEIVARHTELEEKFNNKTITPEETAEAQDLVDAAARRAGYGPQKLFHGTTTQTPFNIFDTEFDGAHFGTFEQSQNLILAKRETEKRWLKNYGKMLSDRYGGESKTFAVYLDIKNPKHTDDVGSASRWSTEIALAKKEGFDGIVYDNTEEGEGDSFIAFNPSQIKSADPFTGVSLDKRFDSANNNIQNTQPINFGDKFSFRLANEARNATDTFLGLKLANDGTLPSVNVKAKISKSGVNEFEVESISNLVDSLTSEGRVNISKLSDAIDNEPTVVINTLDSSSIYNNGDVLQHQLDTRFPGWNNFTEEERLNKGDEFNNLYSAWSRINEMSEEEIDALDEKNRNSEAATGRFGVDPYSQEQLNGEEIEPGHKLIWSGDLSLNIPLPSEESKSLNKINRSLFESKHYSGNVAANQIAFVRGGIHEYQKGNKLPNGSIATETTRIFEIWEVQSDWMNSGNKYGFKGSKKLPSGYKIVNIKQAKGFIGSPKSSHNFAVVSNDGYVYETQSVIDGTSFATGKTEEEAIERFANDTFSVEDSSLLKYWESLALKAALNHAKKEGASNIIISDAETAMMTEGHDLDVSNINEFNTKEEADEFSKKVKGYINEKLNGKWDVIWIDLENIKLRQGPGMIAAYDYKYYKRMSETDANKNGLKIVPNTTDKEGIATVELSGRIPKVLELLTNSKGENVTIGKHSKGPSDVFKSSDGSQKDTNTGRMFPVPQSIELQFSQIEGNENISNESDYQTNQDEDVIDLLSITGESVSTVRKQQIKRINELRRKKIEAKLSAEEKSAFSVIKGIKALASLTDEQLEEYANLMDDFVNTRSKTDNASIERIPIEQFLEKAHKLDYEAKKAWFAQQQEDFPELKDKDFEKDFNSEMDQVKAAIDLIQEVDSSIGIEKVNKNREMYLEKIDSLRDLIIDNIDLMKDNMLRRIDEVSFTKTDNEHLKKGSVIMQETMNDLKVYFEDYLNSILSIDVSQASSKDIRKMYYSLMGVAYDGYMLNADNFISSDLMELLNNDAKGIDVFGSKNKAEIITKMMSVSTQMRATMDSKGYNILNRIASKFRESIKRSQMFQQDALIKYQKESIDKAQKKSGFVYSDTHLQKLGMYAIARRIRVSEDVKSELNRNLSQIKDSIVNLSRNADKKLNQASEWYNKFIDGLFDSVLESETPLQKLEENAALIGIDEGMKGYVNDIVSFFEHFKPISRFTTEFVYGREFKDEYNYVPSMILNLNPESGPMQYDVDDLRFDMTSSDVSERNVNISGMSGTYDRKARLKQNQSLVFNINHLFSNRGRLNFLDAVSAVPRRELASLFKKGSTASNSLKSFMNDEFASKFRFHTLENAFRTMWKNEIQSTQYIHEYQGFVNGILSRWAGVVLSSAYQGVGQLVSNIAPFITLNITNPTKIKDMFVGFSYAAKYRAGLLSEQQNRVYERLLFDLKNRHQDQVLDTSVNLGISKDSVWQAFKTSAFAQSVKKVDEKIEKLKFLQFQGADFWAGAPMLIAEYMHQERQRLGTDVKMEDLVYNEGSYFNALDETERFIGIGNASRRGELLTNRNAIITIFRHILTGFAGHRINNATNAYIEFRKIMSDNVDAAEKRKSAGYIAAIGVQSAVFTAAKVYIISMIMSGISNILDGDDEKNDEDLIKLLNKAQEAGSAEKKIIEAEISKRKEIRSVWEGIRKRQDSSYLMTMNLTKDIAANLFIFPNIAEPITDVFIYSTADAFEEKAFKDFKEKRLEELNKKMRNARNLGDISEVNKYKAQIAALSSQRAVRITMPNQGSLIPFNGMYGGAFRNVENVYKAMRDSYLGVDEFNINDFANLATAFGWSTADILRYTRTAEDIERAEKTYREKVNPTGKNK